MAIRKEKLKAYMRFTDNNSKNGGVKLQVILALASAGT
jgi:hypothetical protein